MICNFEIMINEYRVWGTNCMNPFDKLINYQSKPFNYSVHFHTPYSIEWNRIVSIHHSELFRDTCRATILKDVFHILFPFDHSPKCNVNLLIETKTKFNV